MGIEFQERAIIAVPREESAKLYEDEKGVEYDNDAVNRVEHSLMIHMCCLRIGRN